MTKAADIHGLGAILYAILTGRPPFRGETPLETLEQVKREHRNPPSTIRQAIDRDLETICLKCLEKEPGAATLRRWRWPKTSSAGWRADRSWPGRWASPSGLWRLCRRYLGALIAWPLRCSCCWSLVRGPDWSRRGHAEAARLSHEVQAQ